MCGNYYCGESDFFARGVHAKWDGFFAKYKFDPGLNWGQRSGRGGVGMSQILYACSIKSEMKRAVCMNGLLDYTICDTFSQICTSQFRDEYYL